MKKYRGRKVTAPPILNLGITWRWVLDFTPLPFYPWERTRYPFNKKLDGFHGRSRRFGEDKYLFSLP